MDNGELRGLDQVEDAGQKFSLVDPDKELIYLAPASQQQGKSLFYAVLRDKSDGKYYTQRFQFGIVGGQPTLTTIAQDVFPAVVNEKTVLQWDIQRRRLIILREHKFSGIILN